MDNQYIARILSRIADLMEFKDENPFRVRSYRAAAETIDTWPADIAGMVEDGRAEDLQNIPGIGKAISGKIVEIVNTGTCQYMEELKKEIPETVLDLLRISGIGIKTARLLYHDFGITDLEHFAAFAEGGGLKMVKGLGPKSINKILNSIALLRQGQGKFKLYEAVETANVIIDYLKDLPGVGQIMMVGDARRGCEMVDAVELLASCREKAGVIAAFTSMPGVKEVIGASDEHTEVIFDNGLRAILHLSSPDNFAALAVRLTGSRRHIDALERIASQGGLRFTDRGLFKAEGGEPVKIDSEEEFYQRIGFPYIAPELREGRDEIDAAGNNALPDLVELSDIRGDLHLHSTWSDGANSIREMAQAARALSRQYIALTDHTKSTAIANGLDEKRLLQQLKEIDEINKEFDDFLILKSAEVDILSDGSLDHSEDILRRLDFVIASIHAGFSQSKQQITERVVRAIESGLINVYTHPTGRLLGERPPYEIDLEQVFKAASKHNVLIEINSSPHRLDLKAEHCRWAKEFGVKFVISTDSHRARDLANMRYGVATARRGWVTKSEVLNALPLPEFLAAIGRT